MDLQKLVKAALKNSENQRFLQSAHDKQEGMVFNLSNRANGKNNNAVIFITQKPDYNKLIFSIHNNSKSTINFSAIDPSSAEISQIPILLQFQTVLSNDEIKNITLENNNLKLAFREVSDYTIMAIAPANNLTLNNGQTLEIKFSNVTSSATKTINGDFTANILNNKYTWNSGIALQNPPKQGAKDLIDDVIFHFDNGGGHNNMNNSIYVSDNNGQCMGDFDDNNLIFSIVNKKQSPLTTDSSNASMVISFITSNESPGALSDNQDLNNIEISLGQHGSDYNWEIRKNPSPSKFITWTLEPKNPSILGTGQDSITHFNLNNILTHLPTGETVMYISWSSIDGYNDGSTAISISKQHTLPTITLFEPESKQIPYGDNKVTLNYSMYGAKKWNLRITKEGKTLIDKVLSCSRNKASVSYVLNTFPADCIATLTGIDQHNTSASALISIVADIKLSGSLSQDQKSINLSWDILSGSNFYLKSDNWSYISHFSMKDAGDYGEWRGKYYNTDLTMLKDNVYLLLRSSFQVSTTVWPFVIRRPDGSMITGYNSSIYKKNNNECGYVIHNTNGENIVPKVKINDAYFIAISVFNDSSFIIASGLSKDNNGYYQIYDPEGKPVGEKILFGNKARIVACTTFNDDSFTIAWTNTKGLQEEYYIDHEPLEPLYIRSFDKDGKPLCDAQLVHKSCFMITSLVALDNGNTVITWITYERANYQYIQILDKNGNPIWQKPRSANSDAGYASSAIKLTNGNFRYTYYKGKYIVSQVFNPNGGEVDSETNLVSCKGSINRGLKTFSLPNNKFILSYSLSNFIIQEYDEHAKTTGSKREVPSVDARASFFSKFSGLDHAVYNKEIYNISKSNNITKGSDTLMFLETKNNEPISFYPVAMGVAGEYQFTDQVVVIKKDK